MFPSIQILNNYKVENSLNFINPFNSKCQSMNNTQIVNDVMKNAALNLNNA